MRVGLWVIVLLLGLVSTFADVNLLTNPGFESGQEGWSGVVRGSAAVVVTNASIARSGNNYISNYNAGGWSSASQGDSRGGWSTGVTIPVSDARFYKLTGYVKVPGAAVAPQEITLRYRFEPSGNRVDVGQQTIVTEDWTLLESGWISPALGDTFISYWEVHSTANAVVFYADDCALVESEGYTITGLVKDNAANPVVGAQVQLKQNGGVLRTTTSVAGGVYTFKVEPVAGTVYDLNATKLNYESPGTDVSVTSVASPGVATASDIVLTPLPMVTVSGGVTNPATGLAVADATVIIYGASGSLSTNTTSAGKYAFSVAANNNYAVMVGKFPLSAPGQLITPASDQIVDFALTSSLLVGVYAENLTAGPLAVWTNQGTLGGEFVRYGATGPVAGQSGAYRAVNFNNNPMVLSNSAVGSLIGAPTEITGAAAVYTVSAWLLDPDASLPAEQTYVAWAKRGGPDGTNCELGYGTNPSYGAVGHWGAPDMGFTIPPTGGVWHNVVVTWNYLTQIESVYVDGLLSKNSPIKALNIAPGLPIVLGSGYWFDAGAITGTDIPFAGFIAGVEIYSMPVTAAEATQLATNTPVVHAVGTLQGAVVTADASAPSGFAITATDGSGVVQGSVITGADGTYSFVLPPGTYTVKALKAGFITMPAPQAATVTMSGTATVATFTATASSISGLLVDATTGSPIYNGVVQGGGAGGVAMVTGTNGTYTLAATGCGGFELFADALGYQARNLWFTNVGSLSKQIALTAQVETPVSTNGGFEAVTGGVPDSWIQGWDPSAPATITEFWSTNVPYSGSNSVFVTGAAAFEPLSQFIPADPAAVYNCYLKAVGTNLTAAVWFPMFAFRGADFGEMKGWISGEPAPYEGWSHSAPTTWMQYLLFHTYSGDATQPFVRIAPPAGAVWLSATFCFTGSALTTDQGVFVDDVVMDKVPAIVPLEPVSPDPVGVTLGIERVGGGVQLTWPQGTLLESPSVNGPWTTNNATSPYTVTSPAGNRYYRVILQ